MTIEPLKKGATYDDLCRDVLVPDIAGWRRERLPSVPNVAYMTLAPDWVCEVLSLALESGSLEQIEDHHGDSAVRASPFDAMELELRALWS